MSKTHTHTNFSYAIADFSPWKPANHNFVLIRGITNGDVKIYTHSTTYFCGSKKPLVAILFPSDKLDRIAGTYRNLTLRLSDRELLKARDEMLQQYCRLF